MRFPAPSIQWAARSHVGLVRQDNQDAYFAGLRLVAVADGMGGMAAGDVASRVAIAAMAPLDEERPSGDVLAVLRGGLAEANRRIAAEVEADPAKDGMGTTLTALLFSGRHVGLAHVGDSRAYLVRGEDFQQITRDDTYVQNLLDEGKITREDVSTHPHRSMVSRVLQGRPTEPRYELREAHPADRYLLCSDGLSNVLSPDTIGGTLRANPETGECVDRLVELALRAGAPDNVTLIVADVLSVPTSGGRLRGFLRRRSGSRRGGRPAVEPGDTGELQAARDFVTGGSAEGISGESGTAVDSPRTGEAITAVDSPRTGEAITTVDSPPIGEGSSAVDGEAGGPVRDSPTPAGAGHGADQA